MTAALPRPFRALAHRDYRLFWCGQLVSLVGTWMQSVGQAWLVLELTNSPLRLGLISTLQFGPILLLSFVGGAVSDRFPKRRVLILATSILTLSGAFLAVAILTDVISFWMLMLASAIEAVAFSLLVPSRMALTVMVVGPSLLLNAVVLSQISMNANRILGPAVAGGLMAYGIFLAIQAWSLQDDLAG